MKDRIIIGIFLSQKKFPHKHLRDIVENLHVNQIFVFEIQNQQKYLLTFNIQNTLIDKLKNFKNHVRLHRKRAYGFLYTLNAINFYEKENKNINWESLRNSCLILDENKNVSKLELKLKKVIKYKGEIK